jgi:ABC-type transport system involved in cytochrome bd biosynthesis fused ATPase/permease subunit
MAAIDWEAAVTALDNGGLPCSGGERRILQLSASLAAGTTVSLRDAVTGLDHDNTARLLAAIQHATGKRPYNSGYW